MSPSVRFLCGDRKALPHPARSGGHKVAATEPYPTGVAAQLSAPEISRSPEARCGGPAPMEACERSPTAPPPFLPVLAASPPSFPLRLQPQLCKIFARPAPPKDLSEPASARGTQSGLSAF